MMKNGIFALVAVLILFGGCGYRPVSQFSKGVIGEKIYTRVKISLKDPQNTILIQDAISNAIVTKMHATIAKEEEADSKITVDLKRVDFSPLQYDANGYVVAYDTKVLLSFTVIGKSGKTKNILTSGDYDFAIEANSVISDQKRYEAIKLASFKAVEEFVSKITFEGSKNEFNK